VATPFNVENTRAKLISFVRAQGQEEEKTASTNGDCPPFTNEKARLFKVGAALG